MTEKTIRTVESEVNTLQEPSKTRNLKFLSRETPGQWLWQWLLNEDSREAFKVVISFLGLGATAAAAVGIFVTYQGSLEDRRITQQRLMTERFSKATELLASRDRVTRIGAIFALERIAKDSQQDHWTIMELLSSYVEDKSPFSGLEQGKEIDTDTQSALTVIGRRNIQQDPAYRYIVLANRNLSGANFINAKLGQVIFIGANLSGASFGLANLNATRFNGANLNKADFSSANLAEADFSASTSIKTNLRETDFGDANLSMTKFGDADLSGANLSKTQNLTKNQLIAVDLCKTKLPPSINLNPDRNCPRK
jgi:Pentapeptide repeats (9 copies)